MFSVIVPVYNKGEILENALGALVSYLKKGFRTNWKIIIAERGSSDNSAAVCRKVSRENKQVKFVQVKKRLGLGLVFKRILRLVEGNVIVIEPELANNAEMIGKIIRGLKNEINGPDIFNGSRFMKGAEYNAVIARKFLSRMYNMLVNIIFKTKISDFQCEFKGYRESVFRHLCLTANTNHRFWFTESLVRALKMEYVIHEFPVVYNKYWKLSVKNAGVRLKKVANLKKSVR